MKEDRVAFEILTGKPTRKKPLGRLRRRWKSNKLKEIGVSTRKWIDSAQDMDYKRALANAALQLQVL